MIAEKVDFPFGHEQSLIEYDRTLFDMESYYFAPVRCDQDSQQDRERYHALSYARGLIKKELEELRERKKALYAELTEKYGECGTDKDWYMTMDGSVHLNREKHDE